MNNTIDQRVRPLIIADTLTHRGLEIGALYDINGERLRCFVFDFGTGSREGFGIGLIDPVCDVKRVRWAECSDLEIDDLHRHVRYVVAVDAWLHRFHYPASTEPTAYQTSDLVRVA